MANRAPQNIKNASGTTPAYTPATVEQFEEFLKIPTVRTCNTLIAATRKPRTYTPMSFLDLMEYFFLTDGLVPRIQGTLHLPSYNTSTPDHDPRDLDFCNKYEHAYL
jgi:hypothetical protein